MGNLSPEQSVRTLAKAILECRQALLDNPDDDSPRDSLEDFAVELAEKIGTSTYVLDDGLALEILELLRLGPIYALLYSPEYSDELGDDFKPHKWEGFELDHANKMIDVYKRLIATMTEQSGT